MLQNYFFISQFLRLTQWSFLVNSTTRNAPYIHPSHDSILELWQTFPNYTRIVQKSEQELHTLEFLGPSDLFCIRKV